MIHSHLATRNSHLFLQGMSVVPILRDSNFVLIKYKVPRFARNDVAWGREKEIQDFSLRSKLK